MLEKEIKRKRRHYYIRRKVRGTAAVPRLSIRRSLAQLHVQLIDDINEKTIVGTSTLAKEVKQTCPYGGNKKAAQVLAEVCARKMKEAGIEKICFDRGGYRYHGRIKTFADTLRAQGIKF